MIISWNRRTLGELCSFQRGLTYQKSDEVDVSSNIILRANNVDLATNSLNFDELKFIDDKVKIPGTKKVKKGALLICVASGSKSHLGKVAYIDRDYGYAFGGFMGVILPGVEIDPRYLFYLMTSGAYKRFISELSDGTNINNLKFDDLARFDVPFPPLPEQRRIVALLDEAFAGLETLRANTEKNVQNAREFFNSFRDAALLPTTKNDKWLKKSLDQICIIGDGNHSSNYPRKEELVNDGVPFIRATNMIDGRVSSKEMRFISPEKHRQLKKGHLKTGDILITNRGEIGKTALVDVRFDNSNLNSQIAWLRCKTGLHNVFLFHYLNSTRIQEIFKQSKSGAALQQFTIKQLKNIEIGIPSPEEQLKISENVESAWNTTLNLISVLQCKLSSIDELKQSLLHQAFSGQLKTSKTAAA